jgi:hypothetical protein
MLDRGGPFVATGTPRHLAYLLRLWQAVNGEEVTWRASLESARTGERRAFSSLAALFAYLEEQIKEQQQDAGTLSEHHP